MSDSTSTPSGQSPHFMQTLIDNQWAQLAIGLIVPFVIYVAWGILDVINIPPVP